jgi:UDP-N-acetylmuramoylalanine--D-glutamate ligase
VSIPDVRNKNYAVLGLARSGLAVISLLLRHGARVTGSDLLSREALPEALSEVEGQGACIETGGHSETLLRNMDGLVISPGIPVDAPVPRQARALGIPVLAELEMASRFCQAPIVAVTGSNGKTTCATLLGKIFADAGRRVEVAGNIGSPFSAVADRLLPTDIAVIEVSSFQLEAIETFKPKVSLLLNISPDHIDRHHGYENYIAAKVRIFENQDTRDVAVVNADDPFTETICQGIRSRVVPFSITSELDEGACVSNGHVVFRSRGVTVPVCRVGEIGLPGPHNLSNVAACVAAAWTFDVDPSGLRETMRSFRGVEHRLETVAEIAGVIFVNDSKATNVVSVQCALQSFQQPVILIAGGRDKESDFRLLRPFVEDKVRLLILVGEAAAKMEAALGDVVKTSHAGSMDEAVQQGFRRSERGDVVLLSPACASFDMFRNYEHRGAMFKDAVHNLEERHTHHG